MENYSYITKLWLASHRVFQTPSTCICPNSGAPFRGGVRGGACAIHFQPFCCLYAAT